MSCAAAATVVSRAATTTFLVQNPVCSPCSTFFRIGLDACNDRSLRPPVIDLDQGAACRAAQHGAMRISNPSPPVRPNGPDLLQHALAVLPVAVWIVGPAGTVI